MHFKCNLFEYFRLNENRKGPMDKHQSRRYTKTGNNENSLLAVLLKVTVDFFGYTFENFNSFSNLS